MYYDPEAIRKTSNLFAEVTLLTERLFFPVGVDKKVFSLLGNVRRKRVLEFGCYLGTLTRRLAREVTPRGRVHAVGFTKGNVRIARRRLRRYPHVNVEHHPVFHDVNVDVRHVDVLLSTGALSVMKRQEIVLKKLAQRVKKGGRVVFVDFEKYFHLIPNIPWYKSDEHLIRLFDRAGFRVRVERRKGLLASHIFVHGVRK
jgi:ubiquinone/menaquinone biosynthesis C-methylase UbiE